jgi:hypothetical protein
MAAVLVVLGIGVVVAVALLSFSVIGVVFAGIIVVLSLVPLAVLSAIRYLRHVPAPPGDPHEPAVPSTEEAAYDPVYDPEERRPPAP